MHHSFERRGLSLLPAVLLLIILVTAANAQQFGDRHKDQIITFPAELLVQNGGPIIDIKNPPMSIMHAAKADGVTDDTEAFKDAYDFIKGVFQKEGPWNPTQYYIYIPDGTYSVSDTLIYHGPTIGSYPNWNGTFDLNHIHIIGQSRTRTIIRLQDQCIGYSDPNNPKIVVAFQHPDTVFNNVPGGNFLRNITIDTGRGNPGAVGLYFQGANQTDLRNITVKSDDGLGKYGIWFKTGSIQGYYTDVTVQGFNVGIFDPINPEGDPAFEHLTVTGQNEAGIEHTGGGLSLRGLLSEQTQPGVPAIKIDGSGSQTVIVDSSLIAKRGASAIQLSASGGQGLFARNITTSGYDSTIAMGSQPLISGKFVTEYVSSAPQSLRPGQTMKSLNLPVRETPSVPWYDPKTQWAIVDDYPNIQAAFDSGKPVVCFKVHQYKISGDINVPASVKVVDCLGSSVQGGGLVISALSADPILVEDSSIPIRAGAQRDIIQRCAGGNISNPKGLPINFYLENVNDVASGDDFCRPGQHVYARQIDIEYGSGSQIVCNGGTLWMFGFKTENAGATPLTVKNGGKLEILGGYTNTTNQQPPDKQNPELRIIDGDASVTLFTNLGAPFLRMVDETRNGVNSIFPSSALPLRGNEYRRDILMPLYVSYIGQ